MLTRRHIRVKVMQSLYAMEQANSDNLDKERKFLLHSMDQMYDLLLVNLQLLVEVRKHVEEFITRSQNKFLATSEDKNPNQKFINNAIFHLLEKNVQLEEQVDRKKLNYWELDDEYVAIVWKAIKESDLYNNYMSTTETSFKEDKEFVISIFKEIIAPNDKLYDYIEDKRLTWVDDVPVINTTIAKFLRRD